MRLTIGTIVCVCASVCVCVYVFVYVRFCAHSLSAEGRFAGAAIETTLAEMHSLLLEREREKERRARTHSLCTCRAVCCFCTLDAVRACVR